MSLLATNRAKTHLHVSVISEKCPGLYLGQPLDKGWGNKGREGEGMVRVKGRRGDSRNERKERKGWKGKWKRVMRYKEEFRPQIFKHGDARGKTIRGKIAPLS
jgi:hypothetical protein